VIRAAIGLFAGLIPVPAHALLLCLGTGPLFSLVSDGQNAQFDYLGDGTFELSRPLPLPLDPPVASGIITSLYPIPFALTEEPCEIMGVTQPLSIALVVPSNGGETVFRGCCRDRRTVPAS